MNLFLLFGIFILGQAGSKYEMNLQKMMSSLYQTSKSLGSIDQSLESIKEEVKDEFTDMKIHITRILKNLKEIIINDKVDEGFTNEVLDIISTLKRRIRILKINNKFEKQILLEFIEKSNDLAIRDVEKGIQILYEQGLVGRSHEKETFLNLIKTKKQLNDIYWKYDEEFSTFNSKSEL